MKKIVIGILASICSSLVLAGPTMDGKITYVGLNSNNIVFFGFDTVVNEPGCAGEQIVLPPDSAIKEKIYTTALAAKMSGATVRLKTKGCYNGSPSILPDGSDWGWLYIK